MDIYILRHAEAEDTSPNCKTDAERRLTAKGERQSADAAAALREMEVSFDLILASPLVRAQRTAEIVAKALRLSKRLETTDDLAPGGDPRSLLAAIGRRAEKLASILLVGHELELSRLISQLLAGRPDLRIELKKAGLCKLTVEELGHDRCATLQWLLTAKQLRRMASCGSKAQG
ncbi:MAG: phosphohistidine phosphatase SixA [Verrucomicrobiae bacterium]|nr:phosphohistidine phosphatase SixA [Verrucomicrobiae bacterium]